MPSASDRAHELLRQMLGPQASFRDRQLEGILTSVEDRARTPLVQHTGRVDVLLGFAGDPLQSAPC
jgi:hypothetical protein